MWCTVPAPGIECIGCFAGDGEKAAAFCIAANDTNGTLRPIAALQRQRRYRGNNGQRAVRGLNCSGANDPERTEPHFSG